MTHQQPSDASPATRIHPQTAERQSAERTELIHHIITAPRHRHPDIEAALPLAKKWLYTMLHTTPTKDHDGKLVIRFSIPSAIPATLRDNAEWLTCAALASEWPESAPENLLFKQRLTSPEIVVPLPISNQAPKHKIRQSIERFRKAVTGALTNVDEITTSQDELDQIGLARDAASLISDLLASAPQNLMDRKARLLQATYQMPTSLSEEDAASELQQIETHINAAITACGFNFKTQLEHEPMRQGKQDAQTRPYRFTLSVFPNEQEQSAPRAANENVASLCEAKPQILSMMNRQLQHSLHIYRLPETPLSPRDANEYQALLLVQEMVSAFHIHAHESYIYQPISGPSGMLLPIEIDLEDEARKNALPRAIQIINEMLVATAPAEPEIKDKNARRSTHKARPPLQIDKLLLNPPTPGDPSYMDAETPPIVHETDERPVTDRFHHGVYFPGITPINGMVALNDLFAQIEPLFSARLAALGSEEAIRTTRTNPDDTNWKAYVSGNPSRSGTGLRWLQ